METTEVRPPRRPVRRWVRARPADVIDVFVYVVVLELVDLVFGDSVSLGGFVSVTLALLMSRAAVCRVLYDESWTNSKSSATPAAANARST